MLERQLREAGEAPLDVGPLARSIQILVHDDVGDANLAEHVDAGRIRKRRELPVQVVGEVGQQAAVAVDGLLPMRHRVQHVDRLPLFANGDVLRIGDGDFRDGERWRTSGEPPIDGRQPHGLRRDVERHAREFDRHNGRDGRGRRRSLAG